MRAVECNKACTPVKPNVRISIPAIIATLLAAGAARAVVITAVQDSLNWQFGC